MMSELARTSPPLRRMFQLIDFAPKPHDQVVAQGLAAWRIRRGRDIAPAVRDMGHDIAAIIANSSFIANSTAAGADFRLSHIGPKARGCLGLGQSADHLSLALRHRIAVRLRRLFALVLDCGEPVLARFSESRGHPGPADLEILAAPIFLEDRKMGVFCTLSGDDADHDDHSGT